MSLEMEDNQLITQSSLPQNESSEAENSRIGSENQEAQEIIDDDCVIKKKRAKTSTVWNDFDEVNLPKIGMKAICKYCKDKFATGGKGSSTSHLRRHTQSCLRRKLHMNASMKQPTLPFKSSSSTSNPFLVPGARYSNERMREIIATTVMIHEYPFSIVDDQVWMWAFQYANPEFQKVSRKTVRSDCVAIYEAERKNLKALLRNVSKISLTTDMWKSSHQVTEYMVLTAHFIDVNWSLQKRVLSFVKVPAPRRGVDVANAIFKCLKAWGIESKIFSVTVDNASYNDSCLRNLRENFSLNSKLVLDGVFFHVRCCAHILNLIVQDGLGRIKDIIHNVRETVKYINHNDSRLKSFSDVLEQKNLKEVKLVVDCPTRWNSTFHMLSTALKFRIAYPAYKEREPHYDYLPSDEDWERVKKVCQLLEVFNLATHIISGTSYPTSNLYLAKVWRVKQEIDKAILDENAFMSDMAIQMKLKFDKYWGECNLLMAIASVLDPRCKFHVVNICFPLIYTPSVCKENIDKVMSSLEALYNEYVEMSKEGTSTNFGGDGGNDISPTLTQERSPSLITGFDHIMSIVRETQAVPPSKSELQTYLDESLYIPEGSPNTFCAMEWWRNNSFKYKILSKMAADVLAIPISTVASESTFSVGGRVIDDYRSSLNEESIEALICGGDWLRNKYGLKKKKELDQEQGII